MESKKYSKYQRLDNFIAKRMEGDIYPEAPMEPHISITRQMIEKTAEYKKLSGARVLDAGCGQGIALEIFSNMDAKPVGITFGHDYQICKQNGFEVYEMDQSFLEFEEKTFDLIWCRHAIEHSLFPLFTLDGFHLALKDDGILYIEVPAPSTSAGHENNPNHYSCFTSQVWISLFNKANFKTLDAVNINFNVPCGPDMYHAFWLLKK